MNCQEFKPKLYLLADGELTESAEQAVRIHLAECADCWKLLALLEKENEILSEATKVPSWETDQLRLLEKRFSWF